MKAFYSFILLASITLNFTIHAQTLISISF